MKRIFGVALLALPLLGGSAHATGRFFNLQAGGSLYIKGGPGQASPQAGPWYLYWPLEAHFVAPAPTGYPYWPPPQRLPAISIGSPACPPPYVAAPPVAAVPPIMTAPIPAQTAPQAAPLPAPQTAPPASPQLQLPPYLQPTSYYPTYSGQPPSYWYDR